MKNYEKNLYIYTYIYIYIYVYIFVHTYRALHTQTRASTTLQSGKRQRVQRSLRNIVFCAFRLFCAPSPALHPIHRTASWSVPFCSIGPSLSLSRSYVGTRAAPLSALGGSGGEGGQERVPMPRQMVQVQTGITVRRELNSIYKAAIPQL